ncbi:DUF4355 domain containing protein [Listeria phage LP-KV022]|nr:head scaffolding protein [Listeria phage LP-110]YP_009045161.1 head scaffolding protein [Listeria phage LP-114]AGI11573.1 DUF4355 domain containing protein [Listeria phage LP-110]AHL18695.1 DUF4355 domain-containing protein [Listeria phage LP-114]AWY07652.1 DUF4355 domain containing protein [Listeria phage LP-KV022]
MPIEDQLTFAELQEHLKQNTELEADLRGAFFNKDTVNEYLQTENGKNLIAPIIDSKVTKGIETWKTNNLETIISEEVAKANPSETAEQKRIRELELKYERAEQRAQQEVMRTHAVRELSKRELSPTLADFVIADSTEAVNQRVSDLQNEVIALVQQRVDTKLKGAYSSPAGGGSNDSGVSDDSLTKEALEKMSLEEQLSLYERNPELYTALQG